MEFEKEDFFMEFKEAVKYLSNIPVDNIDTYNAIIIIRYYLREKEKGCEFCDNLKGNKIFIYCPRCGKKLRYNNAI